MNINIRDVITLGLALFAMFFGSGNVIFPPFLGMETSPHWLSAVLAYLAADIIIAVFSIIVMAKNDEGLMGITQRIGKIPSKILSTAVILCIGPLFCIPRTAAVSWDLLMVPVFGFESDTWVQFVFSFVFFFVVWLFVVKPNKICDIVGNFLTPMLLATLATLIIKGLIDPIGIPPVEPINPKPIGEGIIAGSQTMDLFGALCLASIMISTAKIKGYKTPEHRVKILSFAGLVTLALIFCTSIGMAYLGSMSTNEMSNITSQAILVSEIAMKLFPFGGLILGILATLACVTTAIGLISGTSIYFMDVFLKKNNNKNNIIMCSIACCVSFLISNIGLETIIKLANPVLSLVFPLSVVLVILSWFNMKIHSNRVFICATLAALLSNTIFGIADLTEIDIFVQISNCFPFQEMQLGWVIPSVFGVLIGFIVGRGHDDRPKLKIYELQNMKT